MQRKLYFIRPFQAMAKLKHASLCPSSLTKRLLFTMITALLMCATNALAQTVKGTVVDETGEPIIGASVMIKGTNKGIATDIDGHFSLNAAGKMLEVSYIGYDKVTVKAKDGMTVQLNPNSTSLDEVVVTGMQKIDKRLFTGATTKVDAEKAKLSGVADVSRALEGRVAGVSVQNVSGTFGTAPKIRVRGATSIYGTNKPIWVIDGVIQEDAVDVSADDLSSGDAVTLISNAIAGLSADDIESFQVLKDGSATSIYGARAMAGVVVITTKRGKQGRSTVNYTGEFTYRLKPSYSNYNICNSQEQMGIYKEMAAKGWLEFENLANSSSSGAYGQMYKLMADYNPEKYGMQYGGYGLANTQNAMSQYLQTAEFRNTDWFDLLFNENIVQNHSVSISTGSDKATLYGSLSFMNDPGWVPSSEVQRFTANMNAQFNLSKKLSVSLLSNGSYRSQKSNGALNGETDAVSGSVNRSFDINPFSYALNTSRTLDPNATYTRNYAPFNIFDELERNYSDIHTMDMKFQTEVAWKPVLGLELKALGAYRTLRGTNEHIVLNNSNMAETYRAGVNNPNIMYYNTYLYTDPDVIGADPVSVMPTGGIYLRTDNTLEQLDFRGTIQYNKIWKDTHILNVLLGFDLNKTEKEQIYHSDYGVDYDNARIVNITPLFYKQAKEEGTKLSSFSKTWSRGLAYIASLSYSYKGRYTINASGRYEGSNKLGKSRDSRWLPTWSVSGAWNAHEETWFKKFSENNKGWFSTFTFRASYSLVADRGPAWMANAEPMIYSTNVWRPQGEQQEIGLYLDDIENSELTYEKTKEFNLGFDAGFFRNRVNVSTDIYWRNNYDLVGPVETLGVGGKITKWANVAEMKSKGVEATVSTSNLSYACPIKWNTDITFSWTDNEITSLLSRSNMLQLCQGRSSSHFREGYAHSAMFSIPFVGLNDQGIPQVINENGEVTTTDIYFQEYEKLDNLVYEGPTEPTITGGFNNTIQWKNWRLNIFFTYAFGNKIRLDPVFAASYSDQTAMPKDFMDRWVESGDERFTDVPVVASYRQYKTINSLSYAYNAYNYSTARVADGGFVRLKDISLTYDLPRKFTSWIGLQTASLKLDATNLWLVYSDKKLKGQDPEFVNSGGVALPNPKQFTLTVRLGM